MSDMLSQDEINALLGDLSGKESGGDDGRLLTDVEKDVLGEVGNISMGTAATTLFSLLSQKVNITAPVVNILTWDEISNYYDKPCVGVRISYKEGLEGAYTLILKSTDVRIITDLMLGGDGKVDGVGELTDIDMSAIGEAMNQMIGSSATSLASFLNEKIDIDIPKPFIVDFDDEAFFENFDMPDKGPTTVITFQITVGDLIHSTIMQIMPVSFAKRLAKRLMIEFGCEDLTLTMETEQGETVMESEKKADLSKKAESTVPDLKPEDTIVNQETPRGDLDGAHTEHTPPVQADISIEEELRNMQPTISQNESKIQQDVSAQPVQFQDFDKTVVKHHKENIDLLMDVPLDVAVELGKTSKTIKEILEFSPGTIIELDKLAGEPIDILVNGKYVAKGEVVVIDENFAIRVTSIVSAELRI